MATRRFKATGRSHNTIRLIAGEWRGRRLNVLDKPGLRPTTDRVRETVFNWLASRIEGARCLDLFAGTGALGLECLSRGADFVQFVEYDREVGRVLEQNLQRLQAGSRSHCWIGQGEQYLHGKGPTLGSFDIVFLDPPYADDSLSQIIQQIDESGMLADGAVVYIESDSQQSTPWVPQHWQLHRGKIAGQARYELYTLS